MRQKLCPSALRGWPLIIFFIIFLIACGPAETGVVPELSGNMAANAAQEEEDQDNNTSGDVSAGSEQGVMADDAGPAQFTVDPTTVMLDKNGIEVGFTSTGQAYKGNPRAPVLMEEFSDFQCPFCARFFSETMNNLIANQVANGELVIVFYDFPLTNIHAQAAEAAVAARCAGEQDAAAFWGCMIYSLSISANGAMPMPPTSSVRLW